MVKKQNNSGEESDPKRCSLPLVNKMNYFKNCTEPSVLKKKRNVNGDLSNIF